MAVAEDDVLEIRVGSSINDDHLFLNVFQIRVDTLPAGGDSEILTDLWTYVSGIYTPLAPNYPTTWDTDTPEVNNLTTGEFVGTLVGEVTGTGVGETTSYQVASLMIGKTGDRGHQGRKYMGPFLETGYDDGLLVGTLPTNMSTAASAWTDLFNGAGVGAYTPGTYNLRELPTPIFRPFVDNKVIAFSRTQRSRTRGRRF